MSDFDHHSTAWDALLFGRDDNLPEPQHQSGHNVTCKHCGATGLKWRLNDAGEWRLYLAERGERNQKLGHNCRAAVATADDFEDVSVTRKTFEIQYRDPETGEWKTVTEEFDHSPEFPARGWAEDRAYALADKGPYKVREL